MRHSAGGHIAFNRRQDFAGEMGAEFVVGMAAEPGAKILFRMPVGQVLAQQALNGVGNERGGAAVANGAGDGSVLADRSTEAEIEGVGELALVLDLFALDADVCDPMLAATVGAAGDVEL